MSGPFKQDRARDAEIADLAQRLFDAIDPKASLSDSYRRLFEDSITATIESRRELAQANARISRLERLNVTDEVTGALNRRGFNAALDSALARVRRTGEVGVLLIIDLDEFKQINDQYGHQAGDEILASVAKTLKRHTRDTDSVARLGGDEFAVLLANAEEEAASKKIEEIEGLLNSISVPWGGEIVRVSASVGAVPYGAEDMADLLIGTADRQLYEAKRTNPVERTRKFGRLLNTLPVAAHGPATNKHPMEPHPGGRRHEEKKHRVGGGR